MAATTTFTSVASKGPRPTRKESKPASARATGPTSRDTKDQEHCYICYSTNHKAQKCKATVSCAYCQDSDSRNGIPTRPHNTYNCPFLRLCKECDKRHHARVDCAEVQQCSKCSLTTHTAKKCVEKACAMCKMFWHKTEDCKQCENCGNYGHATEFCRARRRAKCSNCNEFGHVRVACPEIAARSFCKFCNEKGHLQGDRTRCQGHSYNAATQRGAYRLDFGTIAMTVAQMDKKVAQDKADAIREAEEKVAEEARAKEEAEAQVKAQAEAAAEARAIAQQQAACAAAQAKAAKVAAIKAASSPKKAKKGSAKAAKAGKPTKTGKATKTAKPAAK